MTKTAIKIRQVNDLSVRFGNPFLAFQTHLTDSFNQGLELIIQKKLNAQRNKKTCQTVSRKASPALNRNSGSLIILTLPLNLTLGAHHYRPAA